MEIYGYFGLTFPEAGCIIIGKYFRRKFNLTNSVKRTGLSILGLLQGAFGSYLALVGVALAFPGTSPHDKDYEEDMFVAPLGFLIMFIWLLVMASSIVLLRKNKGNFLSFMIPWAVGLGGCILYFIIR